MNFLALFYIILRLPLVDKRNAPNPIICLLILGRYLDETGFSMEQSPLPDEDKVYPKAENTVMELKEESNTEISSFCDTVQVVFDLQTVV